MAEPLILAYGRGELPEFPASPDAVSTSCPATTWSTRSSPSAPPGPRSGEPEYYHVSSGARNPLTFAQIYGHIRNYFTEHPFEGGHARRGPAAAVAVPRRRLGGAAAVHLRAGPRRGRAAAGPGPAVGPDPQDRQGPRPDPGPAGLPAPLPLALQRVRPVRAALRRRQHPGADHGPAPRRPGGLRLRHRGLRLDDLRRGRALPGDHGADPPDGRAPAQARQPAEHDEGPGQGHAPAPSAVAIFDLDGTIMSTNVVEQYLWARLPELSRAGQLAEVGQVVRRLPAYLRAEQRDRGTFLRAVYRRYRGADLAALEHFVDTGMAPHILSRLSPEGGPPDPRAPRRRAHDDPDHRRGPAADPAAGAVVRRHRGRRPRGRRRGPLHRLPDRSAAGRGVPGGLAQALRQPERRRPEPELRLRRLALRPADAGDGGQPGRGQPRHPADARRRRASSGRSWSGRSSR